MNYITKRKRFSEELGKAKTDFASRALIFLDNEERSMLKLALDKFINFKVHDDCEHCGSPCETVLCQSCHDSLKAGFNKRAASIEYRKSDSRDASCAVVASNDDIREQELLEFELIAMKP